MLLDDTEQILKETLPAIMDIDDLCSCLNISYRSAIRMIHEDQITAFKDDDGEWNVLRDDFLDYLSKQSNL